MSRKIASTREDSLTSTSARTTVSFGRIVFVNLAKLVESICSRNNWTRIQPVIAPPNANAASGRATSAGQWSPNVPRAQKINAPRRTLRIKAATDPPIAEIPCSSIRCRPLVEEWIAAARRNRARWRFCSTARPVPALWKMPTTKTRSRFFRQNLIPNLIRYDLEISTRLFQLWRDMEFSGRFNFGDALFAERSAELRSFAAQFCPTAEQTVKSLPISLARARYASKISRQCALLH